MTKGLILLCAGGTGGHLFPAEAVAHELISRGYRIHLAADERVNDYSSDFPAEKIHHIQSATLSSRKPMVVMKALRQLYQGYRQSKKLVSLLKPVAVAGFGGYPTVPPVLAASRMGVPTLIHEANAVLGRANKFLSGRVSTIAMGFGEANKWGRAYVTVTGNPVRPGILNVADAEYPERWSNHRFNLFVFGGSQGASFFSRLIPEALARLPEEQRQVVHVVQQARPEDLDKVVSDFRFLRVTARVESFFKDMPEHFASSHLVISRAGASTVSELAVVGRPAILVPYPFALDHDQASNAALMAEAGGAVIHPERRLTPEALAEILSDYIANPEKLEEAAANAKKCGKPDATSRLADMIENLIV